MTPSALILCFVAAAGDLRSDAVGLSWDSRGQLVRVHCGRDDVTGRAARPGGFALRDCTRHKEYGPLRGEFRAAGEQVGFSGSTASGTLQIAATLHAQKGWIVVRGEVHNRADDDRAVSLRFALPVDCKGWQWPRRLHKAERLSEGQRIHLGVPGRLGSGRMALRPVAAITDERHTLGLVVPIDHIGVYDFYADAREGLFAVVMDFAMTRHCPRFYRTVPFAFYILGEADGWGLRSVLSRYYSNRPDLFERHLPEAGGWFAWGDILRQTAPVTDYGLMFHEQPILAKGYAHDEAMGIRVFPYVEAGMYQMCMGDQREQPSREFALARLTEWAKPDATGRLPSGGFPTQEALQRICAAVKAWGTRDAKGGWVIGRIGQYPWITGSRWAAQFPLNLTPAIPGGPGQVRLAQAIDLLRRPKVDGIYLDSYSAHLRVVNYDKNQLAYLAYPPAFDAKTFEPCDLVGFAKASWVDALWQKLPEQPRTLLLNLYGQPVPFPWHRFTVLGKEHWVPPTGALMQQYRAMGFRKIVTQLPSYEDQDERFLRNMLLLDVFPGGYARRPTDPPVGMRESYRLVIPLLRCLDRLGWEPVTHARRRTLGLQIERYGSPPGPVVLAVHNPYGAGVVRLDIDAASLRLPHDAYAVAWLDDAPIEYVREGDHLSVGLGLPGDSTNLLVVGNRDAHAAWLRMLADDRLADVRRCLLEYAVRRRAVSAHPSASAARTLTSGSDSDELARVKAHITGDAPTEGRARELLDVAGDLMRRADAPPVPASRPPTTPADPGALPLPWHEPFANLDPSLWSFDPDEAGVRLAQGRLEMELPRDKRNIRVATKYAFPLAPEPLVVECDFKYSHAGHPKYLMLAMRLAASAEGGDEYILIRIEGKKTGTIRVENHEARATNWQVTLTDWHAFDLSRPHHMTLRLDARSFRLELGNKLVGSGPHGCDFGSAYISLALYSGHRGHGDVCWWDNLRVRAGER